MKNKITVTKKSGMIALFPAIIVSGILLIMAVTESQTYMSLLARSTLFEQKNQTEIIARACLRKIVTKIIQNSSYEGDETISVSGLDCVVSPISNGVIEVAVILGKAKTVDKGLYDNQTQTILEFL